MRRVFLILVSLLVGGSSGLLSTPGKPLPSLRRVFSTQKQLAAAISGAEGGSVDATDARGGGLATVQGSSLPQSIGNLIKNIVGAGVLSLPAGVAAFSGELNRAVGWWRGALQRPMPVQCSPLTLDRVPEQRRRPRPAASAPLAIVASTTPPSPPVSLLVPSLLPLSRHC